MRMCIRGMQSARCFAALLVAAAQASAADPAPPATVPGAPFVLSAVIAPLAGEKITSFGPGFVDPVLNRYYLGNRTTKSVIAVDTASNRIVGEFKPGFAGLGGNEAASGPDGVQVVDHNELWVGDFPSRVWVLDAITGAPIGGFANPISTGGVNRADALCYDPMDKIIAVVNDTDSPPFINFISTATKAVLGMVRFDGAGGRPLATNGAGQCQWNPRDGKIYLSIPEINGAGNNSSPGGVVVLDPTTEVILRTMVVPLAACTGARGLAIGPPPQIGLGCDAGVIAGIPAASTAIIDETTGAVLASFHDPRGGEQIWYNPSDNTYFFAARNDTPSTSIFFPGETVFGIDAGTFEVRGLGGGKASSRLSVAVDPIANQVYVPITSDSIGACPLGGRTTTEGCISVFSPVAPTPEPGCYTATALGDFNADGRSDIGWRNDNGAVTFWLLNGPSIQVAGVGAVGPEWTIAGFADLNGDGRADIVWRRTTDGSVAVWLMNGSTVLSAVGVGIVGPEWHIVGARDFDGDGKADILWRRATDGSLAIWFMNGGAVASAAALGTVGLDWQVFGAGDFDGDGKGDILLRNLNGAVAVWFMNGAQVASAAGLGTVGTDWTIAGVGDFNNDRKSDIVWRNLNGAIAIWFVNGAQVVTAAGIGVVGTDWTISGVGDLDGNGTPDFLWRSNTGLPTLWFMNGIQVASVFGIGRVGTDWHTCQHERIGPL